MKINDAYNQWAAKYDTNENKTRDLDALATRQSLANIPFSSVLELGCGTGKNTIWLSDQAESVLAVDFSREMLQIARQKIKKDTTTFVEADLLQPWTFIQQPVDLISTNLVLEHIEDLGPIFQKVKPWLAPNGHFFICEFHPFKQYQGSKARFEEEGATITLTAFTHHLSEYLEAAKAAELELLEIKEWFDDGKKEVPRLISFLFRNG